MCEQGDSLGKEGLICLVNNAIVQELLDSLSISECIAQEIQAATFHDGVSRWLLHYIEVG